jgi:CDP-paratose synthetase
MKLIITGGSGFIGRHLCKRIQNEKWNYTCIVRAGSSDSFFKENGIPTIELEKSGEALSNVLREAGATGIIHLASHYTAEHRESDVIPLIESNILFGTKLLDAAVKAGIQWFVNTGTFWQHYNGCKYDPVNLYAATKQAFEDIGRYYANAHGLRFCNLKLCDTYGPNDTRNKLFNIWKKIAESGESIDMSPGDQLIDIVHVDQVVEAYIRIVKAMEHGLINHENCESYYVTSGRKITLRELALEYERQNKVTLNIHWGGRHYRQREVMIPACIGNNVDDLPITTL